MPKVPNRKAPNPVLPVEVPDAWVSFDPGVRDFGWTAWRRNSPWAWGVSREPKATRERLQSDPPERRREAARRVLSIPEIVDALLDSGVAVIEDIGKVRIQSGGVVDLAKLIGQFEVYLAELVWPVKLYFYERSKWARGRSDKEVKTHAGLHAGLIVGGKSKIPQDAADAIELGRWWQSMVVIRGGTK